MELDGSNLTTESVHLQIQDAKRRAESFSKSLQEARRQEAKALEDLQNERQKWLASLEEKNGTIDQMNRELASTVFALNHRSTNNIETSAVKTDFIRSVQINTESGDFIPSNLRIENGSSFKSSLIGSNAQVWDQLLQQYKDELTQLRTERAILLTSNSKFSEENSELLKALRDEQAKSQFRISQIMQYEDEKTSSIKREEQLKSEVLQLKRELSAARDSISSLQIELRITSEQKQTLQKLAAEREVGRASLRSSAEAEYMKYEIKINEREELLRSYQTELNSMKDQMRVLNRQLQDALQQRDEQRSKTTSTIESKRRLEEQVQLLLVEMQHIRSSNGINGQSKGSKSTDATKSDFSSAHSIDYDSSPNSTINKRKPVKKVQSVGSQTVAEPPTRTLTPTRAGRASAGDLSASDISGKVILSADKLGSGDYSEVRLRELVEQFNRLPDDADGPPSSTTPSQPQNSSDPGLHSGPLLSANGKQKSSKVENRDASVGVDEDTSVSRIDSAVAEQYYRYNLQMAENQHRSYGDDNDFNNSANSQDQNSSSNLFQERIRFLQSQFTGQSIQSGHRKHRLQNDENAHTAVNDSFAAHLSGQLDTSTTSATTTPVASQWQAVTERRPIRTSQSMSDPLSSGDRTTAFSQQFESNQNKDRFSTEKFSGIKSITYSNTAKRDAKTTDPSTILSYLHDAHDSSPQEAATQTSSSSAPRSTSRLRGSRKNSPSPLSGIRSSQSQMPGVVLGGVSNGRKRSPSPTPVQRRYPVGKYDPFLDPTWRTEQLKAAYSQRLINSHVDSSSIPTGRRHYRSIAIAGPVQSRPAAGFNPSLKGDNNRKKRSKSAPSRAAAR